MKKIKKMTFKQLYLENKRQILMDERLLERLDERWELRRAEMRK